MEDAVDGPIADRPRPPAGTLGARAWAVAWAVARRPDLWWTALGVLRRLAAPGWWRSRPFLPLPDGSLWRFRMVTAYGRPDAVPGRSDVVSYLEWCRSTALVGHFRSGTRSSPGPGDRRGPSGSG